MNRALKLSGICLGASLLIALMLRLVSQSQTVERLRRENLSLKQQLDDLTAQVDQLSGEKEGLLKLIPDQQEQMASPLAQNQLAELLRLRGEVGRLHVELNRAEQSNPGKQAEQVNQEQVQAALAKLPDAEAKLERLAKLHSDGLVSDTELTQAEFAVRVLKAEATGDKTEVAQIKLQQAEAEFERAGKLREQSVISQQEYEEARQNAEELKRLVSMMEMIRANRLPARL